MTVASIAEVEQRTDDTVRVVLQSSEFGNLSVRGAAPVFKLFVPREPADEMMLPTLGSDKLAVPSWEADPRRPIGRSYTAIDFNPGDRRITFDVMDLGKPGWWLNRTGVGSRVGVIGFKHELVLVPGVTDVVAVGDRSARPAVGSLTNLAEQVRIHSFTGPSGEHGFPDIEWVDIVDRTKAQTESTMLWIGGEKAVSPACATKRSKTTYRRPGLSHCRTGRRGERATSSIMLCTGCTNAQLRTESTFPIRSLPPTSNCSDACPVARNWQAHIH